MDIEQKATINIEDEMKRSYLDYAMSVIIGRALPDVRDGLKPVHRRVLWAMHELGNTHNKPYKKSARVVGDVIGKYHPHGDVAVYDTIVRLVQDFSMRMPLIDGQGNFGCFTGDTKIKLADGTEKTFEELAELHPDEIFYVYSVDKTGRIVIGEGKHSRITRRKAQLIELTLDGGAIIRCTPDHQFMLRDGSYKAAADLTENDSLMPGYFDAAQVKEGLNEYLRVFQPQTGAFEFVHRLADDFAALDQFNSAVATIDAAQYYNHRVVSIRRLDETEDVYDIAVDVHHNFLLADGVFVHNSVDGDAAAAMRYTEVRMAKLTEVMLADIEKGTVDFQSNYDETLEEPIVMPARFPNLLINGASGIAVGMATNIPPHNLTEIVEATVHLIQHPDAPLSDIMKIVPGPDFPTGGFICGREGIRQAYATGRGMVVMRARAAVDKVGRNEERDAIIVTQIPYQVNKAKLIERIADLTNEKKIEDISDLRDESDREGMRIVIELKRGAIAQVVLNNLYKLTPMQTSFGIINLAIVAGQPTVLGIVETLQHFIRFRKEVVRRRTEYELRKARARLHILEGLTKALDRMDEVIKLIRASRSGQDAREGLIQNFEFSHIQAQAILDMQLQKLTGLERQKIIDEYNDVLRRIAELEDILNNDATLKNVIVKELREVQKDFGNERRTQIIDEEAEFTLEDLIPDEDVVITVTHGGYIKRTPLITYRSQRRGGTGRKGMTTKAEDVVDHIFVASTHSYVLIFSDKGQVYTLKVHEIPDATSVGKGKAIINLLNMPSEDKVASIIPIREFSKGVYVVMVTRRGTTKKTELSEFAYSRSKGIIAIGVDENDELIAAELSDGKKRIFIATHDGMAIHFNESDVRSMGRQAYGVRGIDLRDEDYVVAVAVVTGDEQMLTVSEFGLGKRTPVEVYRLQSRGGIGVINMKVTDRTGPVVSVMPVQDEDEMMLISAHGKIMRLRVGDIRETGRSTQGVKLIDAADGDSVASASLIERQNEPIPEESEK